MNDLNKKLNNQKSNYKKLNYQKGVAIFIAVIATSAILLIALAISEIAYKEQLITSSSRDSRIAYYAADGGLECALYYDLKGGPEGDYQFPTNASSLGADDFKCEKVDIVDDVNSTVGSVSGGSEFVTTFYFDLPAPPNACAIVRVYKKVLGGGRYSTKIESRGYNNSCADSGPSQNPLIVDGPRNLERALEVTYSPE